MRLKKLSSKKKKNIIVIYWFKDFISNFKNIVYDP